MPYGSRVRAWLSVLIALGAPVQSRAQFENFTREHGRTVLKVLKGDLEKNYYDAAVRGSEFDAHFRQVEEKINSAVSTSHVLGIIAQALLDLNDSHTFFLPPERTARFSYGWRMKIIGDRAYL